MRNPWGLLVAALVAGGCDFVSPKGETPATPVPSEVAETAPKAPPVAPLPELSAEELVTICRMYQVVVGNVTADAADGVACSSSLKPGAVTVAAPDTLSIDVSVVGAGVVYTPQTNSVFRSKLDETTGGWTNFGAVFFGRAGQTPLCIELEYIAEDPTSDSVFVRTDIDSEPVNFGLSSGGLEPRKKMFPQPVVAAGTSAPFALLPREPRTRVKGLVFVACPS